MAYLLFIYRADNVHCITVNTCIVHCFMVYVRGVGRRLEEILFEIEIKEGLFGKLKLKDMTHLIRGREKVSNLVSSKSVGHFLVIYFLCIFPGYRLLVL